MIELEEIQKDWGMVTYDDIWEMQEGFFGREDLDKILAQFANVPGMEYQSPEERAIALTLKHKTQQMVIDELASRGIRVAVHYPKDQKGFIDPRTTLLKATDEMSSIVLRNLIGSDVFDVKLWKGFKSYSYPKWLSTPYATIDLVLRIESQTASVYFTGRRDPENMKEAQSIAYTATHFEFSPEDKRIFDYKDRMRAALEEARAH